ncbi:MAG: Acyl-CoA dehydrogenase, partial [Betaproteobacteria bacterium]|nr:Acyl-CoA dehydrogenase [Betaproteobacteria bacterium]
MPSIARAAATACSARHEGVGAELRVARIDALQEFTRGLLGARLARTELTAVRCDVKRSVTRVSLFPFLIVVALLYILAACATPSEILSGIMKTLDSPQDPHAELREGVRSLCSQFDNAYWQKVDEERGYPEAFVDALTHAGWLSALIPEEYGGSGLTLTEASVIMEEINRSGANSGSVHGQMYNMGTVLRHGSAEQKQKYLPRIATGELRLQSMAVTEPTAGTDTSKIKTTAVRKGDRYVINGQKVWTSRLQHSDLMIVLARTTALDQVKKKSEGMSIFIVDVKEAGKALVINPIRNMVNHETNQLFIDNLEVPVENLIGEEGRGFKYILDGLNAERILIAAECIGDGYWFVDRARNYASERVVFDRPIGQNQGIQ